MNIFHNTLGAMPDKAWVFGRGPKPVPLAPVRATQAPSAADPSAAVAGSEAGPAPGEWRPAEQEAAAGPGEAQDTPETSAPGAALEGTDRATPPAGDVRPGTAPGAEPGESGDVVTPEEVAAEFGPASAAEVAEGVPGHSCDDSCAAVAEEVDDEPTGHLPQHTSGQPGCTGRADCRCGAGFHDNPWTGTAHAPAPTATADAAQLAAHTPEGAL